MTYKTVYNIGDVDHRLRARITDGIQSCISRWRRKPGAKAHKERRTSAVFDVCVIAKSGQRLMPTSRVKARKLLKTGKAVIFSRMPFAIQLNYEISKPAVQETELCVDTGSEHIGISVKSKKHEYVHLQADNLSDEKERHDAQRSYRRARRNRKRYRKLRFDNRKKSEAWLAPSVQHKKDNHIRLIKRILEVLPITRVVLEVGQFDPALMRATEKGETLSGADYQHGTQFGLANIREAVFVRDNYTCRCCGKGIRDGRILKVHHNIHRSKGGTDGVDNLVTVCSKCHTPANHKDGKPLASGAFKKVLPLKDAAFMNIVRWQIVNEVRGTFKDIEVITTYGSYTKASRRKLGQLSKTHANDAYAMGEFHPTHRHKEVRIKKRRRNSRVLSKFYDAKYVDNRTGQIKKGAEIGCNRTDRSVPRNNPNSERIYRGRKVSNGKVTVRKHRYYFQPFDTVIYRGSITAVKGVHCNGARVMLENGKSVKLTDIQLIKHTGGWQFLST